MLQKCKIPAFLFYSDNWLGGTMMFTRAEKGYYIDLLALLALNGGKLSKSEIERVMRDPIPEIVMQKLSIDGEKLFNNRLLKELEKRENINTRNQENGKKGGRPKNPNKTQTITQTKTQKQSKKKPYLNMNMNMDLDSENENENAELGIKGQIREIIEQTFDYTWLDEDDQHINRFVSNIKKVVAAQKKKSGAMTWHVTDDEIILNAQIFLSNLPEWWNDRFSVQNIANKFQQILSDSKKKNKAVDLTNINWDD